MSLFKKILCGLAVMTLSMSVLSAEVSDNEILKLKVASSGLITMEVSGLAGPLQLGSAGASSVDAMYAMALAAKVSASKKVKVIYSGSVVSAMELSK